MSARHHAPPHLELPAQRRISLSDRTRVPLAWVAVALSISTGAIGASIAELIKIEHRMTTLEQSVLDLKEYLKAGAGR